MLRSSTLYICTLLAFYRNNLYVQTAVLACILCRMTDYELFRWLVEMPSCDVDHYWISTRHGRPHIIIMIHGHLYNFKLVVGHATLKYYDDPLLKMLHSATFSTSGSSYTVHHLYNDTSCMQNWLIVIIIVLGDWQGYNRQICRSSRNFVVRWNCAVDGLPSSFFCLHSVFYCVILSLSF